MAEPDEPREPAEPVEAPDARELEPDDREGDPDDPLSAPVAEVEDDSPEFSGELAEGLLAPLSLP